MYGAEYVFYDYNNPLDLPANLVPHSFDIVVADPPYLSEECLKKTAETIKYLTKGNILLCTGRVFHSLNTLLPTVVEMEAKATSKIINIVIVDSAFI